MSGIASGAAHTPVTLAALVAWLSLLFMGLPAAHAQPAPVIAEIRVHGNHTTPDAEVRALAGLEVGHAADAATVAEAGRRLERSGRFSSVEMRTRQRSLTDASQLAIIIVVSEHAAVSIGDSGAVVLPGPLARLRRNTMFLPIVGFEDGYGLTYGARVTVVGARQSATRVSVPLTWGGSRNAALEASHTFTRGPISRASGRVGILRREHPFFDQGETRRDVSGEVLKRFGPVFGVGATAARTDVRFGDLRGRLDHLGAFVEVDTRTDPLYPRNAVHARSSVARLGLDPAPGAVRSTHDVRAYLGLPRAAVLALRAQTVQTSGPAPAYAKAMVGGAASVRGWRAGSFVGDDMVAGSVELRVPVSSPVSLARSGLAVFYDAGVAYDHDQHWRDRRLERGVGVGLFITAPLFAVQLDVARGIDRGTRVHLSTGVSF